MEAAHGHRQLLHEHPHRLSHPGFATRHSRRLGNEELVTSDIEHLVFGTYEKKRPEIQGEKLASVIERLFPVPLVWHGMNSI